MNELMFITISEERSESENGAVIYLNYANGKVVRNEVGYDMIEVYGVPVV
jgi:hypothetical protein